MKTRSLALWVPFIGFGVLGCGSDDGGDSGTGQSGSTITVTGTVVESTTAPPYPVLEGAEICGVDMPDIDCAKSDAGGKFTLVGVPAETQGALMFSKEGYLASVVPGMTEGDDLVVTGSLASTALAEMFAGLAGIEWPLGSDGILAVTVTDAHDEPVEGATGSLASPSGALGPVYLGANNLPDKGLTSTSTSSVIYFRLKAGTAVVEVEHPTRKCSLGPNGWPSSSATLEAPILAGAGTIATAVCD